MFKNKINADTERRREKEVHVAKKDPILEMGGGKYVLEFMVVTLPTCQVERSPLKASADRNTAPHSKKEKSNDENWFEKKREEIIVQK